LNPAGEEEEAVAPHLRDYGKRGTSLTRNKKDMICTSTVSEESKLNCHHSDREGPTKKVIEVELGHKEGKKREDPR